MLAEEVVEEAKVVVTQPNTRSNVKAAKPQTFNGEMSKILGFLVAYKLYIRMRIKDAAVEEYIQWVLSYI